MKTLRFAFFILLTFPSIAAVEALDRPKLRILNAGPNPIEVFWLAPDGRRLSNGRIDPGKDRVIGTTLGHRFAIVDGDSETEVESTDHVQVHRHGSAAKGDESKAPGARFDPVVREIEGWTVHVDPALIEGEHREEGARALEMLANHLQRIEILVPSVPLEKMRQVEIWIEHRHPTLKAKSYHPNRDWLVDHGHDPRLAKKVHIPQARDLLSREQMLKHPAVVLHELAHAYHDQVLGFDHPDIVAAYEKAKAGGRYERVLVHTGWKRPHYGMSNPKEYFAEGTEAFFYRNDFYPFVRAEMREHDPDLLALLETLWEGEVAP